MLWKWQQEKKKKKNESSWIPALYQQQISFVGELQKSRPSWRNDWKLTQLPQTEHELRDTHCQTDVELTFLFAHAGCCSSPQAMDDPHPHWFCFDLVKCTNQILRRIRSEGLIVARHNWSNGCFASLLQMWGRLEQLWQLCNAERDLQFVEGFKTHLYLPLYEGRQLLLLWKL